MQLDWQGLAGPWPARLVALALLSAGCAWQAPGVRAQQVLVQANVANDTVKTQFGPNRSYFGHLYLGYGVVAGPAMAGAPVHYGLRSSELRGGGRLKFRLSQTFAVNFDLGYAYLRYDLAQQAGKLLPTPALHRAETLGLHQLYSEGSLRLNVGRRGNAVGRYLDLLANGGYVVASSHSTEDEPGPGISSVETTEHGLPYVRRWTAGVGARFGIDRYALVGRYRLTPTFGTAYTGWPELPRWLAGIEVGLF